MPHVPGASCRPCELAKAAEARGSLYPLGPDWTINANVEPSVRPRIVLQARRHCVDLNDLTVSERASLGHVLAFLTAGIMRKTGALKVYIASFGESGHVHFHVLPRFAQDPPDKRGWSIDTSALPAGAVATDSETLARHVANAWHPEVIEPSRLVRAIVRVLDVIQLLSLYSVVRRMVPALRGPGFAEIYVLTWLGLLIAILELTTAGWGVGVALYRLADLTTHELKILLDRSSRGLASFTRSLVLLGVNLLEIAVILGIAIRYAEDVRPFAAFIRGFEIVTLRSVATQGVLSSELVTFGGTAIALIFLAGGLSMVVGLIGESFREG